ncbi:MAG: acyl carrier protein [Bdellovibrionales bacterium]
MDQLKIKIREVIQELMNDNNQTPSFSDSDSLFVSGRLDSMAAVKLILRLEKEFGLTTQKSVQELMDIDTVERIRGLLS